MSAHLDRLSAEQARAALLECGGAPRWVEGMMARRPFGSDAAMHRAADEVWATLGPDDWRAAFAHHPRIGARAPTAAQGALGGAWSSGEQAGVTAADGAAQAALAEINREYEARFGHIYIVCASGKSAEELLQIAGARLGNEPDVELRVAGEELRQIMQLRLAKLVARPSGESGT